MSDKSNNVACIVIVQWNRRLWSTYTF